MIPRQGMPRQPKRYGSSGKEIANSGLLGGSKGGFTNGDPSQGSNIMGGNPYQMRPQRPTSMGPVPTSQPAGPRPVMGGDSMQESSMAFDKWARDNGKDRSYTGMDISQMADADRKLYAEWEAGGGMNSPTGGGGPASNPNEPWRQGGGTTPARVNPYAPQPYNSNMDGGDLAKRQAQQAAFLTPGLHQQQNTGIAAANNRYSIGPNGALVAPGSQQMPPNSQTNPYQVQNPNGSYGSSSSSSASYSSGFGADDYKAKYNEAKAANEARYAEGHGELSGVRDRSMAALDNLSGQELADIEQRGKNRQSSIKQNQQSLGLGGTTVGDTLAMGADRETSAEKRRAMDANAQQRIGTDIQTTGDLTGFIERRSDPYPDANPYIQLAMQQASQGVGGGGGGTTSNGSYGAPTSGSSGGGGQRAFINNSVGYGPITSSQPSGNPAPTGVNLEYLTGAALNDPEYMKRFQNTPMTSAPKRLIDQQKYWM